MANIHSQSGGSNTVNRDLVDEIIRAFGDNRFKDILKNTMSEVLVEKLEEQGKKINILERQNRHLMATVNDLNSKVVSLEEKHDDLEQYGRRYSLRLHTTVPEERGEDTDKIVLEATNTLGVDVKLDDISRSHRVGRKVGNKPRPIIFRLISYRTRRAIYQKRKQLDDRQFIVEDLTARRSHLLYLCRQLRRSGILQWVWSSDGRILVREPGDHAQTHEIKREGDLSRFGAMKPPSHTSMTTDDDLDHEQEQVLIL